MPEREGEPRYRPEPQRSQPTRLSAQSLPPPATPVVTSGEGKIHNALARQGRLGTSPPAGGISAAEKFGEPDPTEGPAGEMSRLDFTLMLLSWHIDAEVLKAKDAEEKLRELREAPNAPEDHIVRNQRETDYQTAKAIGLIEAFQFVHKLTRDRAKKTQRINEK